VLALFPADPLRPRRVDEHFDAEAVAARQLGFDVALVDHDLAARGDAGAAVRAVTGAGQAVYRGWMLGAGDYEALAGALAGRGVDLRTSPSAYRRAHELPGWYAALEGLTPPTVWVDGDDPTALVGAARRLAPGPGVLRDFAKSMKHHWHEACYVPDVHDAGGLRRVASRLRELRDDDFTGGYVLRAFEPFASPEVRSWWVDGRCAAVTAHPDTPDDAPPDDVDAFLDELAAPVAALDAPFITVDVVRLDGGRWRVVEVGDGQVSDRPASAEPAIVLDPLFRSGSVAESPSGRPGRQDGTGDRADAP
jgi:hypothetical protein